MAGKSKPDARPQETYELDDGVASAISRIKALSVADTPVIVGIAGGSASGKTSMVVSRIKTAFGTYATIISTDDYFKGRTFALTMPNVDALPNFDVPEYIKLDELASNLGELKAGHTVSKPVFDFKSEEPSPRHETVAPNKLIVVEGTFALSNILVPSYDLCIFVEASPAGQVLRRVIRDVSRANRDPDETLRLMASVVLPSQKKYVDVTKGNAQIVIRNDYNPVIESRSIGSYDHQVRYRKAVNDSEIIALGARRIGHVQQDDEYYGLQTGQELRIRDEGGKLTFCYKGPSIHPEKRLQPKFEFGFNDTYGRVRALLTELFPNQVSRITKQRDIYKLAGITINVDRAVRLTSAGVDAALGEFVELKFEDNEPNRGRAARIISALGLTERADVWYVLMDKQDLNAKG